MSCWCCTPCPDENIECPNLIGRDCINIDKTDPNTWYIEWKCISIDSNTISVDKTVTWNNIHFQLEKDCCDDKRVAACPQDTNPRDLNYKITTSGAITKQLRNCPWDAYIEIGIDESLLNIPNVDEKVAVETWCAPKFLWESITTWAWLKRVIDNCTVKICHDCDPICSNCNIQPKVSAFLWTTVLIRQNTSDEKKYYLATNNIPECDWNGWIKAFDENNSSIPRFTYDNYWSSTPLHNWWVFTLCRAWRIRVWFAWNQEQNKWVGATRVWILVIKPSSAPLVAIQSRYSWLSDPAYIPNPHPYFWPFGNNTNVTSNGWTWPNFSMGRHFERLPVGGTFETNILPAWTKLVPFMKLSSFVDGDPDAQIQALFALIGNSETSADWWDAFVWWISYIDDFCECERIKNEPTC